MKREKKVRELDRELEGLSYEQLVQLWEDNRETLNRYRQSKMKKERE
jgi:hypothetical protein